MRDIQVGLIGFGTIGSGVAKVIMGNQGVIEQRLGGKLKLKWIADRDIGADRFKGIDKAILTSDVDKVLSDPEVDVIVELIGGYTPAKEFILKAIKNGKHVVTANKALLSKDGREIFSAAVEAGVDFGFEASVGGGIPIIRAMREGFTANRFLSFVGIMNGTCNYILSKMSDEGLGFEEVLKEAQAKGYAEANPHFDIEGIDSAHKIAILASIAYGGYVDINKVYTEGISNIAPVDIVFAREFGYRIKLLAIAKESNGEIEVRVHPTMIPDNNPMSSVNGVLNAIEVKGDMVGNTIHVGSGAGSLPTASAVVGDIIEIGRNIIYGGVGRVKPLSYIPAALSEVKVKDIEEIDSAYYLRFSVIDKPNVLSKLSGILGGCSISIASVIQKGRNKQGMVPLVIMTHLSKERDIRKAVSEIDLLDVVLAKTAIIRIEGDTHLS